MPDLDLDDRVIAVTGAGGRLGRRLCRHLAARGATLAALDRPDALDVLEEHSGQTYPFDATDEGKVRTAFAAILERQGRLDALVHTVGAWAGEPLLETSQADFQHQIDLNLTSAFLCFREAVRQMQATDDPIGRLVGIASGQGADRGAAEQYGYSAAKAGVMRLVEAAAEELNGTGLTAHAVAPSTILFDEETEQEGVPAKRLVELIEYLLSPAGEALSGATLRAYGSAR